MEQHADEGEEEEEEVMWGTIVTQIVVRRYLLASPMGAGGLAIFCLGSAIQISCTGNWMELGEQMQAGGGGGCVCVYDATGTFCVVEKESPTTYRKQEKLQNFMRICWRVDGGLVGDPGGECMWDHRSRIL